MYMHNWYHSNVSGIPYIHEHRLQCTTIHGALPLLSLPLAASPLSPLCSPHDPFLLTWNPPSCDRTRPPRSQVACKLTSPDPTLYPNPPPSKFPETHLPAPCQDDLRDNPASSVRNNSCFIIYFVTMYRLTHLLSRAAPLSPS
jgi:hypothetical protein